MKRLSFLKDLLTGSLVVGAAPALLAVEPNKVKYSFDELFNVPYPNPILVYIKPESNIYKEILKSVDGRVSKNWLDFSHYRPEHKVIIPVKEFYTIDDFNGLIYFMECVYEKDKMYSEYDKGVFFRLIKDKPDRMHLDLFGVDCRKYSR